jgi:hypothetical protein
MKRQRSLTEALEVALKEATYKRNILQKEFPCY